MWVESLLQTTGAALSLWNSKEKTKYQDEFLELSKRLYEERNKPDEIINHALIDKLKYELCLLGQAVAAKIGEQNSLFLQRPSD